MEKQITRIGIIVGCILVSVSINTFAQTKVIKKSAAKSNDYGVEYFLPKTILHIDVQYSKTTQKAGQYAKYAEKYLGVKESDVIMEDGVTYTLDGVSVSGIGIPDKSESYLIELKSKTTAPFVYLTEDGMICTINAEYTPEKAPASASATKVAEEKKIDPRTFFSEEYLRAGSVGKMAEVLAKQIYKIRESRNDILTGEAENVPRDGEGMKIVLSNLEIQERTLMELFIGSSVTEKMEEHFELEPRSDIEKEVVFRFSKFEGIVDSDNLSGSPVYINVTRSEPEVREDETATEAKKKDKEAKSIVYNLPGRAVVEIYYGLNRIFADEIQLAQFGTKQILATSLFEDKKAPVQIFFYPNTGAIKQIVQ